MGMSLAIGLGIGMRVGGGAPASLSLSSASINADTLTLVFSQPVKPVNANVGSGDLTIDLNGGGSIACTYASGTGTNTIVFTAATPAAYGDSVTFTATGTLFQSAVTGAFYGASLQPVDNWTLGVVSRWSTDDADSGTLTDTVGSVPLTAVGTPTAVAGKFGDCARLSSGNYWQSATSALAHGGADFTCTAWIYLRSVPGDYSGVFGRRDTGQSEWVLYFDASAQIRMFIDGSGNVGGPPLSTGSWHHLALTVDQSGYGAALYVDGVAEAVLSLSTIPSTASRFAFGANDTQPAPPIDIDEAAYFGRCLTPAEVYALAQDLPYPYTVEPTGSPTYTYTPPAAPVRLILDTDFNTDQGDVGALTVAHGLRIEGEADLIGVIVDSTPANVVKAVDAINTTYGLGGIPIGRFRGTPASSFVSDENSWVTDYANNLTNDVNPATVPDGVDLYRTLLAASPDNSVVISAIGFLNVLRELLESTADGTSAMTGVELVTAKVNRLIVVAGYGPDGTGREYNFIGDGPASKYVIDNWPGRIEFNGYEVGVAVSGGSGKPGIGTGTSAWDQIGVLLAVRGSTGGWFTLNRGTNTVFADGGNVFRRNSTGPHSYATLAVSGAALTDEITRLQQLT